MGSVSIAWRLVDGPNETGSKSHRIGDIETVQPADHEWNGKERTIYGIAVLTDIPDGIMDRIHRRACESVRQVRVLKQIAGELWLASSDTNDYWWNRRYSVSKAQCLAEWPALSVQLGKMFDPTFMVPTASVPSLPWAKFAKVFYDRVNEEFVADLGA